MTEQNNITDNQEIDHFKAKEENIKLQKKVFKLEEKILMLEKELRKFKGNQRLPPTKMFH